MIADAGLLFMCLEVHSYSVVFNMCTFGFLRRMAFCERCD